MNYDEPYVAKWRSNTKGHVVDILNKKGSWATTTNFPSCLGHVEKALESKEGKEGKELTTH